jgi:hypothetical protein
MPIILLAASGMPAPDVHAAASRMIGITAIKDAIPAIRFIIFPS